MKVYKNHVYKTKSKGIAWGWGYLVYSSTSVALIKTITEMPLFFFVPFF